MCVCVCVCVYIYIYIYIYLHKKLNKQLKAILVSVNLRSSDLDNSQNYCRKCLISIVWR